jgi:aspartyl-tRNA synthetase
MQRTLIKQLPGVAPGEEVLICGWLQARRDHKYVQFFDVRDHTGLVQVTIEKSGSSSSLLETINAATLESAIIVHGSVVHDDRVRVGGLGLEIMVISVEIAGPSLDPLPIQATTTDLDLRLDWRFLDLRRPEHYLIFQVQTVAEHAMREFWMAEGFTEIHSPKLMGSASESGSELFRVDYFANYNLPYAYLAQSPQFYKQMAMAAGFDRVFEIGPVFRANPSFTPRHDTEFTSVDFEISWIASHEDLMAIEERWIQYFLKRINEECGELIMKIRGHAVNVPTLPFPRVSMAEAYEILEKCGETDTPEDMEKYLCAERDDLNPAGEKRLHRYIKETTGHDFVFVYDYPISARPFYHMRHPDRPDITKSFDLLWCGLEVTSGAQREHRHDVLLSQVIEKGIPPESIQFYLDFFKYGMPPHGGFGFGLTRMLMNVLGFDNVREVTYLYRGPKRLSP